MVESRQARKKKSLAANRRTGAGANPAASWTSSQLEGLSYSSHRGDEADGEDGFGEHGCESWVSRERER